VHLILIAPPGAGKGTQADRICERFGLSHISTGELFRRHVSEHTPLGHRVQGYLARGDLVPDDIVGAMVRDAVLAAAARGGFLLDGYPRTLAQARAAHVYAEQAGITADAVIHLDVPEGELLSRLLGRAAVSGRPDDTEAIIRHRLGVYREKTAPVLDYYRGRDILVTVDGNRPADEVTAALFAALDRLAPTHR